MPVTLKSLKARRRRRWLASHRQKQDREEKFVEEVLKPWLERYRANPLAALHSRWERSLYRAARRRGLLPS